jgi:hypothetical protein
MQQWHTATMAAQPSSVLRRVTAQSSYRDKAAHLHKQSENVIIC